jgi:hypothetical protein
MPVEAVSEEFLAIESFMALVLSTLSLLVPAPPLHALKAMHRAMAAAVIFVFSYIILHFIIYAQYCAMVNRHAAILNAKK